MLHEEGGLTIYNTQSYQEHGRLDFQFTSSPKKQQITLEKHTETQIMSGGFPRVCVCVAIRVV